MSADFSTLAKGDVIGRKKVALSRSDLVKYAGASGDFNPIHINERFATEVGLPGVIAHGMLTMGVAIDVVTAWCQDPARVFDYQVRFSNPVPVPDSTGNPDEPTVELEVSGVIGLVKEDYVRVDLTVLLGETKVLAKAQALVKTN